MSSLLDKLNPQQQEAVKATHGPVLILAGAGSGKTRTLTHRIAYLVEQKIAAPHEILAVTFTNKAAREMKERVNQLVGNQQGVTVSTFHSLGVRLLREQAQHLPRTSRFAVTDAGDSERLVRQAITEQGLSTREWSPKQLQNRISKAKNSLLRPEDLAATAQSPSEEILANVYDRYQKLLAKNDSYDFDDLLIVPLNLLDLHPDIRKLYQQRWNFLSVDEYQDTNPPQDRLLELLMNDNKNVCVVGDDYQAIYSWRGAKVDHILRFESRFPGCTTIYLTQNYRSTPPILEAANQVIAENTQQRHKELWTSEKTGEPVTVVALPTDRHEAAWIRQQVTEYHREGGKYSDICILYRTNAQSRLLEEEFLTHRLPYTIVGGFRFYERKEVKDALALLSLAVNPNASLSLRRLAQSYLTGVGPKTLMKWEADAEDLKQSIVTIVEQLAVGKPMLSNLVKAVTTSQAKQFATVAEELRYLLDVSGYTTWLKKQPDGEERWENIEELFNVTSTHSDPRQFLEEAALLSDLDTLQDAEDRIMCMSLHASKGLEFPVVYIVGCEEGLLPHINSIESAANLEEERRLLYVGMTRARKKLTMTHALTRFMHGESVAQLPSRFFDALPASVARPATREHYDPSENTDDYFDLQTPGETVIDESGTARVSNGSIVQHATFGRGVVIDTTTSTATCIFESHGIKTVAASTLAVH